MMFTPATNLSTDTTNTWTFKMRPVYLESSFDSQDGVLVAELAELKHKHPGGLQPSFDLDRGENTDLETFTFRSIDKSGGDVAGWHYQSRSGRKVLIIND